MVIFAVQLNAQTQTDDAVNVEKVSEIATQEDTIQELQNTVSEQKDSADKRYLVCGYRTSSYVTTTTKPVGYYRANQSVSSANQHDILISAAQNISILMRTNAAVNTANGNISIKGSRANGSGVYIDGMRVGTSDQISGLDLGLGYSAPNR